MQLQKLIKFIVPILIFSIASLLYFHPVLKGEKIAQSDIRQFIGMSKEIVDYRAETGEEPYWTGAAFSGMPAFQLSAYYPNDFVRYVDQLIRFLPRPADYVFLYFFSFFILLIALKTEWKLAVVGALAFGFSTYLIIIFGAGHNAKAHAIGYMPLVLAGVVWIFKEQYRLGFFVTAIAMALELYANHPQMTYYMGFMLIILGLVELIEAFKRKQLPRFATQVACILFAVMLGVGANATRLMAMKEYAAYSTRGTSELTIAPDGSPKEARKGLSKDYITEYSYGKAETFNLIIPRYMGGGTIEQVSKDSNTYQFVQQKIGKKQADGFAQQVLTYWGDQPIVEAPAYIGAVVFFLFLLGAFLVKGTYKKWLVATTIFSILLSWGKNLDFLTQLFIDYMPLYDKFRAVSSIQVIAELSIPLLAIIALKKFFHHKVTEEDKREALKKALYVGVGIVGVAVLYAFMFETFEGIRDEQYSQLPGLIDAVIADRKAWVLSDSLRTIILMGISAGVLWMVLQKKLDLAKTLIIFTALILFDLVSIDKRYVNTDDFSKAKNIEQPFVASKADLEILKDTSYYRVANFMTNPMQDGRTAYFHNSIGGYHAAKLGRYQELFDYQMMKNNTEIFNMLNVKYFIVGTNASDPQVQLNEDANGPVWFVDSLKTVKNANEEIQALDSLPTQKIAVIKADDFPQFATDLGNAFANDSLRSIELTSHKVTMLQYKSSASTPQFAVFSEIDYQPGWNAYIDGQRAAHYTVNYVLRGLPIPAGTHTIEFRFEPKVIQQGGIFSLVSYAMILLFPLGMFMVKRKENRS